MKLRTAKPYLLTSIDQNQPRVERLGGLEPRLVNILECFA